MPGTEVVADLVRDDAQVDRAVQLHAGTADPRTTGETAALQAKEHVDELVVGGRIVAGGRGSGLRGRLPGVGWAPRSVLSAEREGTGDVTCELHAVVRLLAVVGVERARRAEHHRLRLLGRDGRAHAGARCDDHERSVVALVPARERQIVGSRCLREHLDRPVSREREPVGAEVARQAHLVAGLQLVGPRARNHGDQLAPGVERDLDASDAAREVVGVPDAYRSLALDDLGERSRGQRQAGQDQREQGGAATQHISQTSDIPLAVLPQAE